MNETKYKIVGKEFDGINIKAFVIENDEGQKKSISLSDILKLIRGDKINNASCILDTNSGNYVVQIIGGLESIEEMPANNTLLTVTARLLDCGKCIGYKVQDKNGRAYKLSIAKIWELASQGCIKDITPKIINGHKVLLSTENLDISSLPVIKK